jgi:hypothetical protein
MMATDPHDRPTPAEVVEICNTLAPDFEGPDLATWAGQHVFPRQLDFDDPLVGSLLAAGAPETAAPPKRGAAVVAATGAVAGFSVAALGAALVGVGLLVLVGLGGAVWWWSQPLEEGDVAVESVSKEELDALAEAPVGEEDTDVDAEEDEPDAPAPEPPTPRTTAPASRVVTAPDPEPVAEDARRPALRAPVSSLVPKSTEKKRAPRFPVTFTSSPKGATVFIDGRNRGLTPIRDLRLTEGTHKLKMVRDGVGVQGDITVGATNASSYEWKVSSGKVTAVVEAR